MRLTECRPPLRWETLGKFGTVKADAAGIVYAVERDWLIISGLAAGRLIKLTHDANRRLLENPARAGEGVYSFSGLPASGTTIRTCH
jgi:hypothetical protein